jgi:nucleoside-diphosphate-sugar epimerase
MKSPTISGAKALVVGGAGFVGANLVRRLLDLGAAEVLVVENFLSSDPANLPEDGRISLVPRSITDDEVLAALPADLDFVWHLACYHGNQSSIADPMADHENGAVSSLKLFEALKGLRPTKVVYAAAGCAVAEKTFSAPGATLEDAPVSLFHDSPYSISKLVGEMYGNYYYSRYGLPFVRARFQNVYGPREILGAGRWRGTPHTVWRNVTPTFIFRALHGESLPLDGGGETGRDFIHVDDLAEGLIACALRGEPGEAYNLATGVETSIRALADLVNAAAGNVAPHDIRPARDWDRSGRRFGDPSKSREKLGFVAATPLDRGVAGTVAWTRENLPLIRRCMGAHAARLPDIARYLRP